MPSGDTTYQIVLVLEGVVKVGDPTAVTADQHVPLFVKASRLCPLEHHPLVEDLHGVDSLRVTQFDDADLSEGTTANHLDDLKVVTAEAQVFDLRYCRLHCKVSKDVTSLKQISSV